VCFLAVSGVASTAAAQTEVGIRAGVSGGPSQFFIGAHLETPPLARRLTFRPNVEVGFGSNQTLTAINIEFAYTIPLRNEEWAVYVGGGPAAIIRHFDNGGTDFGPGFNFLGGLKHNRGLFFELKLGAHRSPDVKFVVGYAFR
jgi:hypothetical protein